MKFRSSTAETYLFFSYIFKICVLKYSFPQYKSIYKFIGTIVNHIFIFLSEYHVAFSYTKLPAAASFNDYLEYIMGLPLNDNPSLFGMHSNADITCAQTEAYTCLATLLIMQPREIGIAAASIEEETIQITNSMLATMPKLFDLIAMEARY